MKLAEKVQKLRIPALLLAFMLSSLSSCRCDDDKKSGLSANRTEIPGVAANVEILDFNGIRLTPEQVSNQLRRTLGINWDYTDHHQETVDGILSQFNVPLGGVDFQVASFRDQHTKVQTILILNSLAWQAAARVVGEAADENSMDRSIFSIVNIREDRPFIPELDKNLTVDRQEDIIMGEERWNAQLIDLYWRLLARAPSYEEVDAIRETFIEVTLAHHHYNPAGWVAVMYALLASYEFWSI